MKYKKTEKGYLVRLEKGEKVSDKLLEFAKAEDVKSGVFNAIGAVSEVELGYYHLNKKEYTWTNHIKDLEIVSLNGNIVHLDDKPFVHAHGVFADEENACFGGHLKEAVVGATCEIFVIILGEAIHRKFNDEIGLNLLDI